MIFKLFSTMAGSMTFFVSKMGEDNINHTHSLNIFNPVTSVCDY